MGKKANHNCQAKRENSVAALISRCLNPQQLPAIAGALFCCSRLCPVLSGIGAGWEGRPLTNITEFSKSCIWIVSKNSLKSEWKLKLPENILAESVRDFSVLHKRASSRLHQILLQLQQCSRFGQDSVMATENRDIMRSLLQLETFHTKSEIKQT